MMFPCLGIFLVFIIILTVRISRADHEQQETFDSFWIRENKSNITRKQDITSLSYLSIPLDQFPLGKHSDSEVSSIEEELCALAEQKILNLAGKSNTDLKIQYGAANLDFLSKCDENCAHLFVLLEKYGQKLLELEDKASALMVLEYAISIGSDVSDTYLTLARLYQEMNATDKIDRLIRAAGSLDSFRQKILIDKLNAFLKPSVL